ncbi:MAG: hypothetical protein IKB65_01230 [Ruminiclostridium sp.]|nr:hypothetical protein [Ruminiclostridium sp.]
MKPKAIILAVLSIGLLVWGISDLYHSFTIGKDGLAYYGGADVIHELVRDQLIQGRVKVFLSVCLLLVLLVQKRKEW